MQINFNTHNPNFTMAIKAEPLEKTKVANYLSKKIRNMTDTVELNKLIASQQTNTADIYLSTTAKSNNSNEKLRAIVGGEEFISENPLKAIHKAVKSANKINDEKLSFEARTKGVYEIISKIIEG